MTTITKSRPKPTRPKPNGSAANSKGRPKPSRDIKWLNVTDLHVSRLNMRHGKDVPEIDDAYLKSIQCKLRSETATVVFSQSLISSYTLVHDV